MIPQTTVVLPIFIIAELSVCVIELMFMQIGRNVVKSLPSGLMFEDCKILFIIFFFNYFPTKLQKIKKQILNFLQNDRVNILLDE